MTNGNGEDKEELYMSPETIGLIQDLHHTFKTEIEPFVKLIPGMNMLLTSIATAQQTMAAAATNMALTNDKAEKRYARISDRADGKGMMTITSHYLVVGGLVLIMVLLVLWVTRQNIDANLTSLRVTQEQTKQIIKEEVQKLEDAR